MTPQVFLKGAISWRMARWHSSSQRRLGRSCVLLALVALVACKSDGSTGPVASPSHAVGASLLLYDNTSNDGIIEAELLLDGKKVTANQKATNGTFQYLLTFNQGLSAAGTHKVSVRIVDQKYPSVEYLLSGAAIGLNLKTGANVQTSFPKSAMSLRVGDVVEVTVDVP
jgi:hypothetical protein